MFASLSTPRHVQLLVSWRMRSCFISATKMLYGCQRKIRISTRPLLCMAQSCEGGRPRTCATARLQLCVARVSRVPDSDEDGVGDVRHNLPRFTRSESPAPIVISTVFWKLQLIKKRFLRPKRAKNGFYVKNQRLVCFCNARCHFC